MTATLPTGSPTVAAGFSSFMPNKLTDTELAESLGEMIDSSEVGRFDSGAGPYPISSFRADRDRGQCSPIFENELDLAWYRGASRAVEMLSAMAGGAVLDNLHAYTFGYGWSYEIEPADTDDAARAGDAIKGLIRDCQRLIDDTLAANEWTERQAEWDRIVRVDGDMGAAIYLPRRANGVPTFREIQAEYITEPINTRAVETALAIDHRKWDWGFGVMTPDGDLSCPMGLFVNWDDAGDCDFFPIVDQRNPMQAVRIAKEIKSAPAVWYKRNTRRNVKRGLGDFFPVVRELMNDKRLARNVGHGAAVQAAIAWIEQYSAGVTPDQITADANRGRVGTSPVVRNGSASTRGDRSLPPGSTLKVGFGKEYKPGPMGAERNAGFGEAAQLVARRIGIRWQFPEFMISGDASNANYSSTLAAESPFTKARQRDQRWHVAREERLFWTVLAWAVDAGRFAAYGIDTLQRLRRLVNLTITTSEVESADRLQDAQIKEIEHRAGVLSVQTWRKERGYDHDTEETNRAAERSTVPPSDQPDVAASSDPEPAKPAEPISPPAASDNAALDAASPDLRLNGAQLAAARDTLADIVNRRILPSVGEALLIALGLDPEVAKQMTRDTEAAVKAGALKSDADLAAEETAATATATPAHPVSQQAIESVRESVTTDVIRKLWEAYP